MLAASPNVAEAQSDPAQEPRVAINVIPFVWAPDFKGSMRQGPLAVPLDISAKDIAGGLKVGFMGYGDVRTPGLLVSGQVVGARFSKGSFEPLFGARTRAELASVEALAGPRIRHGSVEIVPLAGLRYNHLEGELNPGTQAEIALARDWTIGMIGAQAEASLMKNLNVRVRLTGGVIGPGHFRSQDTVVAVDYRVAKRISLVAGYRWAHERIDPRDPDGDLGLSLDARGPIAAVHFGPF